MESTSSASLTNQKSTIGSQIQAQGGHVQIGHINVHVNKPPEETNEDFQMPRLIDTFNGREEEIKQLDHLFFCKNKTKIVIHGLPGYGKTELSKQYAHQCLQKKKVKHVFWIKAENEDQLIRMSTNLKKLYKRFEDVRCIYIFDNALNRRSICDYEPSNKHKLLITSHSKDWGHGIVPLKLNTLTSKPAVKIFKNILEEKYREEDRFSYVELALTVDNVPLGIQIVAGYVRQRMNNLGQSFRLTDCVEEIQQSKEKIINDTFFLDNPNPYKNSIYSALKISLLKLEEEPDTKRRELALNILFVCAFLEPEWIFIYAILDIPTIKEQNNDETELKAAVELLINFSFANYADSNEWYIKMHRLTQSFLRYYLTTLQNNSACRACLYSLFCFDNFGARSVLSYTDVNTVNECLGFLKKVLQDSNEQVQMFVNQHDVFYKAAEWNQIEVLRLLLDYTDINDTYNQVLYSIAQTWNVQALELLIERGVNLKDAPVLHVSLLSLITSLSNYEYNKLRDKIMSTLAFLLEHGVPVNVNSLTEECEYILLSAALENNKLQVLESLLQHDFTVNSRGKGCFIGNSTVLHKAAANGNIEAIKMLITYGADANSLDDLQVTPSFKFVQYVINKNRNIDKPTLCATLDLLNCAVHRFIMNKWGYSLLDLSAWRAHENLVSLLVEVFNFDVNQQTSDGESPLHRLIYGLNHESDKEEVVGTVQKLKECGASLDIKNNKQETPLKLLERRRKWRGYNLKYLVPLLTPTDMETIPNRDGKCIVI